MTNGKNNSLFVTVPPERLKKAKVKNLRKAMSSDLDFLAQSPPAPMMPLMPPPPQLPQQNMLPPPPKPPKQLSHDQFRLTQSFSDELEGNDFAFDAAIDNYMVSDNDNDNDNDENNVTIPSSDSEIGVQIQIFTNGHMVEGPMDGEHHTNERKTNNEEISIEDWLEENGIKNPEIIKKFVNDGITVSELEMYSTENVQDLCNSYNITVPFNIKLKKAVLELQQTAQQQLRQNSHSHTLSLQGYNTGMIYGMSPIHAGMSPVHATMSPISSPAPIQRIVVFPEEDYCGKQLDDKLDEIMKCHEQFNQVKNTLRHNASQCGDTIRSVFNTLRNVMNEREEQLLQSLQKEMNTKMEEINDQQQSFIDYQQQITNAKMEFNQLLMDFSVDRHKRQQMILNLTKNAIDSYGHIMNQKIKQNIWLRLGLNSNIVGEYLLTMGKIGMLLLTN